MLGVEDCVFVLVCGLTPILTDFRVNVLLDLFCSLRVLRAISAVLECVVFGCVLRFISVPVSGSHSKCAGLTRSTKTVSTLPFMRIFITLPLLEMTLYGPSRGAVRGGDIAICRKNTCKHALSFLYWKMSFCVVSRGGHNRRRDMATRSLSE